MCSLSVFLDSLDVDRDMLEEVLEAGFSPREILESAVKQALPRIHYTIDTRKMLISVFMEIKKRKIRVTKANLLKTAQEMGLRKSIGHSTLCLFVDAYSHKIRIYHDSLNPKEDL